MSLTRLGAKEELCTSVGEAVDVTCTEHNHPPDQASNKAKKLVSFIRDNAALLDAILDFF